MTTVSVIGLINIEQVLEKKLLAQEEPGSFLPTISVVGSTNMPYLL